MKFKITTLRPRLFALAVGICLLSGMTGAATIGLSNELTAIGESGNTLTSVTYGATTYTVLTPPTSFIDNTAGSDWLHQIGPTAPADLSAAIGSLDLSSGGLNQSFEAQFSGLTDSSLFYLLINGNDLLESDIATIYPIDASGGRLGGVNGVIDFANNPNFDVLRSLQTFNRTTNGSSNGTLDRLLLGVGFTLTDLGIGGQSGTTGIEFVTANLDPQEIGLMAIPEPSSLIMICLSAVVFFFACAGKLREKCLTA